jgi:tetratricopeptide (TPR) repeat protein
VVARFEAERQALALMDHPNIAQIFDGGATDSGRPYFVMELVRGIPITSFCDQHHVGIRERLELFTHVCQAVQHAHQKGIIHRDLKPSNVMVTQHDVTPVVKIIDFGIAKATGRQLTDKTLFTNFAQFIGTPMYMSPEQAQMSGLDVDTRSDVYSLGVLLYELLTGTSPFDRERLRSASYDEMIRIIREEEPVRPSTRISTLGNAAITVPVDRNSTPRKLSQLFRGELDWIVLKALEKDRNRRYESAGAFANDVRRFLEGGVVQACPPTVGYRLRKLARRNKAALATAAMVFAALAAGTTVAIWQAVVATQAEQRAILSAGEEKKAKEAALEREAEAKAILGFFEDNVINAARPADQEGGKGVAITVRQALISSLPYVQNKFTDQPSIAVRLRMSLGRSFYLLGEFRQSQEQYALAQRLNAKLNGHEDPITLNCARLQGASMRKLGQAAEAAKLFEDLLSVMKSKLGPHDPETLNCMVDLASAYDVLSRRTDALALREQIVSIQEAKYGPEHPKTILARYGLSHSYIALRQPAKALPLQEAMVAHRKATLGPEASNTLNSMSTLGATYEQLDRYADSVKLYEEVLAIRKTKFGLNHPATLKCMNDLADCYRNLSEFEKARQLNEEALTLCQARHGLDHDETLRSMSYLAAVYADLRLHNDALELREKSLRLHRAKFGPAHNDTLSCMRQYASTLVDVGRGAEAIPIIDECIKSATGPDVYPTVIPNALEVRMRYFAKNKDAAGYLETSRMWDALGLTGAKCLYDAACAHAKAAQTFRDQGKSAEDEYQSNHAADQAMVWLRKAVAAGFKDAGHIAKDPDLDVLRDRPDFITLLAGLAAKPKAKK